jgi:hypothetical protein
MHGVVFTIILFSYWLSDYASGLERLAAMVFSGAIGVFSIIATANTRALFLYLNPSGEIVVFWLFS